MVDTTLFLKVVFILMLAVNMVKSQCTDTVMCSARGVCKDPFPSDPSESPCVCNDGYTTHPMPEDNTVADVVYCNYKQKDQLTAFLLSLFIGGAGAGRFYVESYLIAGLKLAFCVGFPFVICCVMCCCAAAVGLGDGNESIMKAGGGFAGCCICLYSLGVFVWCLVDIILFGLNDIPDGNGVELASW